jgi:FkbM family methyltransferase
MRNPLRQLWLALAMWWAWRREPGLFKAGDAALQFHRVLLPRRWLAGAAGRALTRTIKTQLEPDAVHRITLRNQGGLVFFWPALPDPNLWYLIEQETDPRNPHYYTTPPVALMPGSRVLDVGACEGLFAFRCLRQGLAREVIAFEPSVRMAPLLRRGAEANGVADRLRVVESAVGALTGTVAFDVTDGEQSGRLAEATAGTQAVPCTTLDDFCAAQHLELGPHDLIKVDAEGADLDVLRGAEQMLRSRGPQVAVTTYHTDAHAREIVSWLREVQPRYHLRLKGFSFWTPRPRPVLLLASLAAAPQH